MDIEFITQNWMLFLALAAILLLLALEPVIRRASGIKQISAIQLPSLINHESAVVVDVCEPGEFRKGHIPDSLNLPLGEMKQNLGKLEKHRDQPIVLSCRSGSRANRAASTLRRNKFTNLYILRGGMLSWEKENLPVERG
ncbi:MAG: rhodanese-like domain-containing protein [Pseudomonadota bacterium]|nr:rhodanese-like domain-containing protein [Pseudomonadota bacterium]